MAKESFHTTFEKTLFDKFKHECAAKGISTGKALSFLMNYSNQHHWLPQNKESKPDYMSRLKLFIKLKPGSKHARKVAEQEAKIIFPGRSYSAAASRLIFRLSIGAIVEHMDLFMKLVNHDQATSWSGITILNIIYSMTKLSAKQFKLITGLNSDLGRNRLYVAFDVMAGSDVTKKVVMDIMHEHLGALIYKLGETPRAYFIRWSYILKAINKYIDIKNSRRKKDMARMSLNSGYADPDYYPLSHMYSLDLHKADGQKELVKRAKDFAYKIIPKSESPYWRTCSQILLEQMTVSLMINKKIVSEYYGAGKELMKLSPESEHLLAKELYGSMQFMPANKVQLIVRKSISNLQDANHSRDDGDPTIALNVFAAIAQDTLLSICGAHTVPTARVGLNMACTYLMQEYSGLIGQVRTKNKSRASRRWDEISDTLNNITASFNSILKKTYY